jgi:hypothetical protein
MLGGLSYLEDVGYHPAFDAHKPALHLLLHLPARRGQMVGMLGVRRPPRPLGGFYTVTSGTKSASVASPTLST